MLWGFFCPVFWYINTVILNRKGIDSKDLEECSFVWNTFLGVNPTVWFWGDQFRIALLTCDVLVCMPRNYNFHSSMRINGFIFSSVLLFNNAEVFHTWKTCFYPVSFMPCCKMNFAVGFIKSDKSYFSCWQGTTSFPFQSIQSAGFGIECFWSMYWLLAAWMLEKMNEKHSEHLLVIDEMVN